MSIEKIKGGVTAPKGFAAAAVQAQIKYKNRTDMALVYSKEPCVAAGVFTSNVVKAAPVQWDREKVAEAPFVQAIVANSGIANACTGVQGRESCRLPQRQQDVHCRFLQMLCCWALPVSSACSCRWIRSLPARQL